MNTNLPLTFRSWLDWNTICLGNWTGGYPMILRSLGGAPHELYLAPVILIHRYIANVLTLEVIIQDITVGACNGPQTYGLCFFCLRFNSAIAI